MMKACSLATHLPIEQAKFVSQPLNSCSACGLSINFLFRATAIHGGRHRNRTKKEAFFVSCTLACLQK